jgi:hypothetical protein
VRLRRTQPYEESPYIELACSVVRDVVELADEIVGFSTRKIADHRYAKSLLLHGPLEVPIHLGDEQHLGNGRDDRRPELFDRPRPAFAQNPPQVPSKTSLSTSMAMPQRTPSI